MHPLILTIDVGSSSTRAMLLTPGGDLLPGSVARASYPPQAGADGAAEADAEALLEQIFRCVDGCLALAGPLAAQIVAVAAATFAPTLVGLDDAGQPVTPLLLYADTRATAAAAELRAGLGEPEVLDRTGCPLRASYHPARLRWLAAARPAAFRRAARWCSLADLLSLRLFGCARLSLSLAAWTGLLNRRTLAWDEGLLAELGLSAGQLAELVDAGQPLGEPVAPFARRWPALAGVPWLPAIGDGAAANLGSGCAAPGAVALTVGTSAALRTVPAAVAAVPPGLWCYRIDRRRALLGGATSEGGNLLAWMTASLNLGEAAAALASVPPDSHGLTVLPFLAGERSPGWAGDVRASIVGLSLSTTPAQILRAGLEAVAFRLALIDRLLPPDPARRYVASGGAIEAAPGWGQILADALGAPLALSAVAEPTARGAALLAGECLGLLPDAAAVPAPLAATFQPDPAAHACYAAAIARQQDLYRLLIGPAR